MVQTHIRNVSHSLDCDKLNSIFRDRVVFASTPSFCVMIMLRNINEKILADAYVLVTPVEGVDSFSRSLARYDKKKS